jgi:predicted RNA-binding protein YlqC (UPF0109 family)
MSKILMSIIMFLTSASPVENQGDTSACAFYATTTAIEYSYFKQVGQVLKLDPLKLYDEYRNGGSDTGVDTDWLLDETGLATVFEDYAFIRVTNYSNGYKNKLQEIIDSQTNSAIIATKNHVMCAVAYTEDRVICQNSYGTSKDNNGFTEVKYNDIKQIGLVNARTDILDLKFTIGKNYFYKGMQIIKMDTEPVIDKNGRTLVPLRAVMEAIDADVEWNAATKQITIRR